MLKTVPGYPHLSYDNLIHDLRSKKISGEVFRLQLTAQHDLYLADLFAHHFGETGDISLMALGSYGRSELCPHSDIDIMLLSDRPLSDVERQSAEAMLYAIWDAGLKVGHACRTIDECLDLSLQDSKIMTSLIDARTVKGNVNLGSILHKKLNAIAPDRKTDFLRNKLQERDSRHARFGESRYVLEPNIKEGKGGLRDYQTLLWIADIATGADTLESLVDSAILTEAERQKFKKSHRFLLDVRCHLHDIAGRAEDRLHFDIQPDLAERLGYKTRPNARAVERFMKHYFLVTRDIGDMTRIILSAIEHDLLPAPTKKTGYLGFELVDNRLAFDNVRPLSAHPLDILRIFHVAQEGGYAIHPSALKNIARNLHEIDADFRDNVQANAIFMDILTSEKHTGQTLRRMNEAGVLGRFVPDFARIIALMQFDRYHNYTVDEHTIRCIDFLIDLRAGLLTSDAPVASGAARKITGIRAIYTAVFLHDICKGRGGRHAELGAELALALCPRFGLNGEETDLVSWLVLEHLLMSDTAFRRNMNDPKTIADFSARVRVPERLDLLMVLTTVDIMGVGPGRWTAWKARLLEELYEKTHALMAGEEPGFVRELTLPDHYRDGETLIDIVEDHTQSATVVLIYTPDRPGLFATLCGALSAEGASIMRAYISTIAGPSGAVAADRFIIQNASGLPFTRERRQEDLRQSVRDAIDGRLDFAGRIAAHREPLTAKDLVFDIAPKITLDNTVSGSDTVVEIETRDRHGLLFDLACVLNGQNLDIRAAKINTQGLRAIDSFYIQTAKGKKLTDQKTQAKLIAALTVMAKSPA